MTVSTRTISEYRHYWHREHPCLPPEDGYITSYRRIITTADNPKESRTKPSTKEALILQPTAQPKQYKDEQRYGKVRQGPFISAYENCSGVYRPVYYTKWLAIGPTTIYGVAPDTYWSTKMRLMIKDEMVNLGQSLFEYRQTCSMFGKFAKGAKKAWDIYRDTRKLRFRKKLTPCNVAAASLTANFGLKPLVSDLQDSYFSLLDRLGEPIYKRVTVRDAAYYEFVNASREGHWTTTERAIAYLELDTAKPTFTVGNPLEVSWELVPFSFVIDWAIPIGDSLSALDALSGVKSVRGTLTRKTRYFHRYRPATYEVPPYTWERPSVRKYHSHERTVLTSIPLPRVPKWEPSRSWKAVQNGLSLLTTLNAKCDPGRYWSKGGTF